ncbi:uncharacterized protein BJX67DRAFT_343529 [Aspergillus lucknowensis]|uniref:Uncharacterized protein n=1 Tax=Aspergillus lucknowensis TaxID=176173 RepID=A0ABR4M3B8_9EURO
MPTTTLITLPFLALVSLPLAITALITIFFSTIALFLQLFFISIELCFALLTNLFTIPPSTSWSLLSLTGSEPTTPNRRRSSDHGLPHSPVHFRSQSRPTAFGLDTSNPLEGPEGQGGPPYSFDSRYPQRPSLQGHPHHTRSSGFLGLISGAEDRDFEGLGGWRCPPSSSKSPRHRSGRTTPSSNSIGDEVDDIAWISMNSRLELPSQPLTLRRSSSAIGHNIYGEPSPTESHLPRRRPNRVTIPEIKDPKRSKSQSQGRRHHQRSATTSMLAGYNLRSAHGQTAVQSGNMAARSQSHTAHSEHWGRHAGSLTDTLNTGSGSYFALQPRSPGSGAKTTSNTTPNEERKPPRGFAASLGPVSHYIPALGNRRTSFYEGT